jgi:hypothetical protein
MSGKRKSSRGRRKSSLAIAIGIGVLTMCVSVYVLSLRGHQDHAEPELSQSSAISSVSNRPDQTTVVLSTPNTNDCRRYELNLTTGTRSEQGPSNCSNDGKQPGRLETISKSFRNH